MKQHYKNNEFILGVRNLTNKYLTPLYVLTETCNRLGISIAERERERERRTRNKLYLEEYNYLLTIKRARIIINTGFSCFSFHQFNFSEISKTYG